MLNTKSIRAWYQIHKWSSLICTAFLLLLCITGLPLIFGDEIDAAFGHEVAAPVMPANTPDASLDAVVAAARRKFPREYVQAAGWDDDRQNEVAVFMAPVVNALPEQYHTAIVDSRTAQVLDQPKPSRGFMYVVFALHTELFAGLPGDLLLGVMGMLFVAAIVSGVILYGLFMRKLDFGAVRKDRPSRIKWLDLHNLLGVVTLTWALVVGLTGVMNTLADPLFDYWRSHQLAEMVGPYEGQALPAELSSPDAALRTAKAALPGMTVSGIVFPYSRFGSPHHYLIWTHGNEPLTSRLFTPALVDAASGRLTQARALPWYLRLLEVCRPLHFGDYGGLPLKIIWALLDIVLIVVLGSGLYLFLTRRSARLEALIDEIEREERPLRIASQGAA